MLINASDLLLLLVGKTVVNVENVDNGINNFTLIMSDGSSLDVNSIGDDMSYTELKYGAGGTS